MQHLSVVAILKGKFFTINEFHYMMRWHQCVLYKITSKHFIIAGPTADQSEYKHSKESQRLLQPVCRKILVRILMKWRMENGKKATKLKTWPQCVEHHFKHLD